MTDNRRLLTTSLGAISRRRRLVTFLIGAIVIIGVAFVLWPASQQQQDRRARRGPPREAPTPVLAVPAKLADVPVYLEGVGTARALNTVTVRAQVEGKLISINFKEGQDVKKGDVLARIDPTTYQAQLDQAIAKKAQDEAQLANARLDLERFERLAASNSIAKQQADTQRATVRQLDALVKADQGAIENAAAILAYTNVTAPINGRTGIRLIDEGNIIRGSDTTGIVVLTEIQPISVLFTLPQQTIAQVNAAVAQRQLTVEALAPDNETVIDRGVLQVVDNQVDPTTGTVKLKAEFPNANLQLWSGQFVNTRLLIDTRRGVVVVPTAAVQRGPDGTFVFVVQGNGENGQSVKVRPVTVTQQDDVQAVIDTGLQSDEQVVTTGFAQLADGTRVRATAADAPPRPRPVRPEGGRRRPQNQAPNAESTAPGTAANPPPANSTPPNRGQRSSTGAATPPT
jgi:multidrug efflux system membrane fusion protein